MMTFQMAVGRAVLQKVVGQPENHLPAVVTTAREALDKLNYWMKYPEKYERGRYIWHVHSSSWDLFKSTCREHNVDLPAILQDEKSGLPEKKDG